MGEIQGKKLFAGTKVSEEDVQSSGQSNFSRSPLKPGQVMGTKASSLSLSTLSLGNAEADGAAGRGTEVNAPIFVWDKGVPRFGEITLTHTLGGQHC